MKTLSSNWLVKILVPTVIAGTVFVGVKACSPEKKEAAPPHIKPVQYLIFHRKI
jgi:regulation of enolase protein 1 (concanavalin A-like superfamily)